jgi:hypothetical protein
MRFLLDRSGKPESGEHRHAVRLEDDAPPMDLRWPPRSSTVTSAPARASNNAVAAPPMSAPITVARVPPRFMLRE